MTRIWEPLAWRVDVCTLNRTTRVTRCRVLFTDVTMYTVEIHRMGRWLRLHEDESEARVFAAAARYAERNVA